MEDGQDKSRHSRGNAQGFTLTDEIPAGHRRGVWTPWHSMAWAPAGEGREGHRSQPAETISAMFLKAAGETQQPGLPAHTNSRPAPNPSTNSSAGVNCCLVPRALAMPPRQPPPKQGWLAGKLPSAVLPRCFHHRGAAFPPPSPQGAPSCGPGITER